MQHYDSPDIRQRCEAEARVAASHSHTSRGGGGGGGTLRSHPNGVGGGGGGGRGGGGGGGLDGDAAAAAEALERRVRSECERAFQVGDDGSDLFSFDSQSLLVFDSHIADGTASQLQSL
jgi:hypothetical protein